ncbi:MAG: hypothetical protein JW909_06845 [Planctomycetes bacterium]|nr:hypothetical protein [Planctomycetota bacterium]
MTVQCTFCSRLKRGSEWDSGVIRPGDTISRGICPACARSLRRKWGMSDEPAGFEL